MKTKELHLRDYIQIILKRRHVVFTFFIIVFLLTIFFTFSATSIYKCTTKLYIERAEPASFIKDYGYSPYDPEFFQTQFELIKSMAVSSRVVTLLAEEKEFINHFVDTKSQRSVPDRLISWVKGFFGFDDVWGDSTLAKEKRMRRIAKKIAKDIQVSPIRNSKIIEISYFSKSPKLAHMVANTVAKAYINAVLDMRMSFSKYTIQWVGEKVDEERARLDDHEKTLQFYMKQNDIITLEDRLAIIPEQLSELSTKLIRAETHRKELEVLYEKLKEFSDRPDEAETMPTVASDETVRSLREQLLMKEQQVMELSKKYGQKHPQMIRALSELDVLKEKKHQEIFRAIESIKNEYDLSLQNEKSLRAQLEKTKSEALNMSERFVQYEILKREVDTSRHLYDSLIKKMKEQSITEEIKDVNIWIVEEAQLPLKPVKPQKVMNIFLGILFGMFGGVGLAFFIEYLDNTIKSPEDAEEKLGITVLGSVAFFGDEKDENPVNIQKIVLQDPGSIYSESYKGLRTSIMLSSADTPPKSVLITSAGPGEGKTTTASNLALALALSERSVLLIDSDMRRPMIHKVFGVSNDRGLSTLLTSDTLDVVQQGPLERLDILTSGPIPPNPPELLDSMKFHKMVEAFRNRYDFIICDSPPVLSVTDSILLSKHFDGTILVAHAGKTPYDAVRKGIKQLQDADSHVLGIFVNAFRVSRAGYFYSQYNYNYYYAYKEDSTRRETLK